MPIMNPKILDYLNKARQSLTPSEPYKPFVSPETAPTSGDPSINDTPGPTPEEIAQYNADYDKLAAAENEAPASDIDLMKSRNGDTAPNLLQQVPPPSAFEAPARVPAAAPTPAPAPAPELELPAQPQVDPADDELRQAQEAAAHNRTLNGLARSGDMLVAALTGAKKNGDFYDQLDKNSQQSVEDVNVRRKAASENIDLKNKQSLQDPNSPDNQAFRQFIQTKMPALAKSPGFERLTLANPAMAKIADMWMRSEDNRVRADATAAQREQTNAINLEREKARQARYDDDRISKHADRVEKAGLADLADSVTRLDRLVGGIGGKKDVAGMGKGAFIPGFALGEEGRAVRQEAANLRDAIMKARSGGAVTPQESERMLETLGTGMGKTDAQFRQGLAIIRDMLVSKLENAEAATDPALIQKYRERGGHTTAADFKQSLAAPAQKTGPKPGDIITLKDGRRARVGADGDSLEILQ